MDEKVIMDTNVPAKATTPPQDCKDEELEMQQACIAFVQELTRNTNGKLVLDMGHEIQSEYERRVSHHSDMGRVF